MSDTTNQTHVEEVEMNLDQMLNSDNIMIPDNTSPKPNFFSSKKVDVSFLDKKPVEETPGEKLAAASAALDDNFNNPAEIKDPNEVVDNTLDEILNQEVDNVDTKTGGRPKTEKNGLLELTKKLIQSKVLIPFDDEDDKKLEDYTINDYEELLTSNMKELENKFNKEIPIKFFDSLPEDLQAAFSYVSNGGQDLKGMFRALAQVQEVRDLDPTDENDQKDIIRNYLQATRFGTPDEIDEEIDGWADRNELEAKANKFKPKLDAMQEQMVAQKLEQQERLRVQQQAQSAKYMDSVYNVLAPGELGGMKLDKKTQGMLYNGLVDPRYPSMSGKPTNLLGHLLEKHQFVEPNHALIAEALWLLQDPDGYRDKVREIAKKDVTATTVRSLKTEQGKRISGSSGVNDDDDNASRRTSAGLKRPTSKDFFKR